MLPLDPDYTYRIKDEPKASDAPVDYKLLYDLARARLDAQGDRIERIDGKSATIIAGVLAAIGFSIDHMQTWYQVLAVGLYVVPLAYLYFSYRVTGWDDSPSLHELVEKFPWYPMTSLATAVEAMVDASSANGDRLAKKSRRLNTGFALALIVTALVVASRVVGGSGGAESPAKGAAPHEARTIGSPLPLHGTLVPRSTRQ